MSKINFFSQLSQFQYVSLQLTFSVQKLLKIPPWPTAWLREQFAKSMKSLCCRNPIRCRGECERPLECAYGLIVETPADAKKAKDAPRPFSLYTPLTGPTILEPEETITMNVTLWGQSIELYPLLFIAWRDMGKGPANEEGIRQSLLLQTVRHWDTGETVYQYPEEVFFVPTPITISDGQFPIPNIQLKFITPVRMTYNQRLVRNNCTDQKLVELFFRNVIRRVLIVMNVNAQADWEQTWLQEVSNLQIQKVECEWKVVGWYSRSQKKVLKMGGLVGTITLSHLSPTLYQLLKIGEAVHIGKNTTFGLGKYQMEVLN